LTREYAGIIKRAREMGILEARIIPAEEIEVREWVRLKCEFGCRDYGTNFTCPPYTPAAERMKKIIGEYSKGIIFRSSGDYQKLNALTLKLEKEAFLKGFYKAQGFLAGPCRICGECPRECIYPEKKRPSMEAASVDVFATVSKSGFAIEVLQDPEEDPHYFSLILME